MTPMRRALLLLLLLCGAALSTAAAPPAPRTLWKNTTLDWFRFTPDSSAQPPTFRQRVLYSDAHWDNRSRDGPLLVFFSGEGAAEDFWANSGALFEMAPALGAKVVFLEHRYYGRSLPVFPRDSDSDSDSGGGSGSGESGGGGGGGGGGDAYGDRELRFLTVEQSLADMSDLLARKGELLGCAPPSAAAPLPCPAVLFGGSYGGMQAAWHRLKYPHLSAGALAASAPVDLWPGEHKQQAFVDAYLYTYDTYGSAACGGWMRRALARLGALANASSSSSSSAAAGPTPAALALLGRSFVTCAPPASAADVARLLMYVQGALSTMAMVDYPFNASFVTPMPASPVAYACAAVGPAPTPPPPPAPGAAGAGGAGGGGGDDDDGDDAWLFASLNAVQNVFLNWTAQLACHNTSKELLAPPVAPAPSAAAAAASSAASSSSSAPPSLARLAHAAPHGLVANAGIVVGGRGAAPPRTVGAAVGGKAVVGGGGLGDISRPWNYMACSSLILEPLTSDGDGFFVERPDQVPAVERACRAAFRGVAPRPGWMPMAYGNGNQLAASLRNVFFSDGDKDPWRVGGMPDDSAVRSPDGSVVRLLIKGAAHHQDLRAADPTDSPELTAARETERQHIAAWLGLGRA